jgi:carbon monoxide dehydrogenase subunit G
VELENSFAVAAPPDRVWEFLLDLERVTPCMPGAELEELVDERTWKGSVTVRLGAVKLSYASTVVIEERDDAQRRVVLKASGREKRGKGMANATINSRVEAGADGSAHVTMSTDLTISGAVAQYGRGMIADVSKRLTDEFASCLQAQLAAQPAGAAPGTGPEAGEAGSGAPSAAAPPAPPQAKPISGIRLALWALLRAIGRFFKRLFGRGRK